MPALAHALVSDPPALAVGRAHYSMICAPDGGILDDLIVYRLAEERFLVVANASNAQLVSDLLVERSEGFRAILDDRSLATALIAVQGPRSLDILAGLTDVDLGALRYYAIAEGTVAGIDALVARTGYTGEDGFELFVENGAGGRAVGRPPGGRGRRTAWSRSGSARATPSASRPGCRSTATTSTRPSRPTTRGSAGS